MAKLMKSDVVNSIVEKTGLSKKDANARCLMLWVRLFAKL